MYARTYTYLHIYISTYTYLHMCIYTSIYIYTSTHACLNKSNCMYVFIHKDTYLVWKSPGHWTGASPTETPGIAPPTSSATSSAWSPGPPQWSTWLPIRKLSVYAVPGPPNVALLRALWSLLDGIWGVLKGSWGALVYIRKGAVRSTGMRFQKVSRN